MAVGVAGASKWPLEPDSEPLGRSESLLSPASEPLGRSKWPFVLLATTMLTK